MGKAPDPPPAPDYVGAANAQGAANVEAARASAKLSNPNIIGPLGSQTVTYGADGDADIPTVTQTLTPAAQNTLDAQQRVQLGLANLGEQALDTTKGIIGQQFSPTNVALQTNVDQPALAPTPDLSAYGYARSGISAPGLDYGPSAPTLQQKLDTSNVAALPVNAGTTAQQAIMSRLQPQIQQNRESLDQQLANQGITLGSEAYKRAHTQQQQGENDLYTQAALQGLGLDLSANAQGMENAQTLGNFSNNAALQQFGAGLGSQNAYNAAQGQQFAQNQQNLGLFNSALAQNQQTALQQQAAANAANAQQFNQDLQAKTFGNQAAANNLQQQLALYNQPLNQIAALMSGSQIQMPQFQGYTGQNIQAAPVFAATQAAGDFAQKNYANQVAASNGLMGGIGDVFGGLTSMVSPF